MAEVEISDKEETPVQLVAGHFSLITFAPWGSNKETAAGQKKICVPLECYETASAKGGVSTCTPRYL